MSNMMIESVTLTEEQKAEIADLLKRARLIVERVSSIAYGQLKVREFRRDYSKGKLHNHLTPADQAVMMQVIAKQELIVTGFVPMVVNIVRQSMLLGTPGEFDDLVQEGLEILILALVGYNGSHDLTTYFWNVVSRHFQDLARHGNRKHRRHVNLPEDMDIEEITPDNPVEDSEYDIDILTQAMQCVRLTPLERAVLDMVTEGRHDAYTAAAAQTTNPKTGNPYTRMSASNAHREARKKIMAVYNTLLVRAKSRHHRVA